MTLGYRRLIAMDKPVSASSSAKNMKQSSMSRQEFEEYNNTGRSVITFINN